MTRRQPRVLVLHPSDELYGADRVVLQMVKALSEGGARLHVALPTDVEYPDHRLCRALRVYSKATVDHRNWPVLRRSYLRTDRIAMLKRIVRSLVHSVSPPDLLIANTSASLLAAAAQPLAPGGKRVLYLHESLSRWDRVLLSLLLTRCHQIVAVSASAKSTLPAWAQSRAVVLHNGFSDVRAKPFPDANASEPLQVLLASRWNQWKGHEVFLDAWNRAAPIGAKLTILGGLPPNGTGFDVADYVRDQRISSVELVGEVPDSQPYLDRCHLVVVPSQAEDPLPTIAIEALRSGRPVAASAAGGLIDIVTPEVGWLVSIGSVDAWVNFLKSGLSVQNCMAMSAAARERYLDEFSGEAYEVALRELLLSD